LPASGLDRRAVDKAARQAQIARLRAQSTLGSLEDPMLKIAATLLASVLAAPAGAVTVLTADLSNANENPPTTPTTSTSAPRPASFGNATFTINDAQTAMTFTATIFNIDVTGTQTTDINDNLVNAHLHAGPAAAPTLPVVWGFFGAPFNDINPNDQVVTPFATGVGGTFSGKWDAPEGNNTTFAAQLANLLAGRAYINFHTVQFGGGEIRGNLVTPVPEPEAYALLLAGFAAIGALARRRPRGASLAA
jgi:hypothetical protein